MPDATTPTRRVQIDQHSGKKPRTVAHLRDWEYLERSLHRLLCAWGRFMPEWNDKVALHRHVWEQAECVRRLRHRLTEFPGNESNLDQPVSPRLEQLANAVLLAPSLHDAIDGIYQVFANALIRSYTDYCASAHPVHDAPTVAALQEIAHSKENMRLWLRQFRRMYPHRIDPAYEQAIEHALNACGRLTEPLSLNSYEKPAAPAGLNTSFRLPRHPARPAGSRPRPEMHIMPHLEAGFATSVETRRLFWCVGYMREMNLAMDQLRWLYDAHFMPWEFQQDISRHLWDESRHGDSGHSRLLDFGIALNEIGFDSYNPDEPFGHRPPLRPLSLDGAESADAVPATGEAEPLTPADLYTQVFHIGMIAETGHFQVKREAYDDFKAGGDMESAEMMIFDIIDEQSHVQYAHRWLPVLARHAGIDNSDYRQRAAEERARRQQEMDQRLATLRCDTPNPDQPTYRLYQNLLQRMRRQQPLSNADDSAPRSDLPM